MAETGVRIFTIGHSTGALEELVSFLEAHGVNLSGGCAHGTPIEAKPTVQPGYPTRFARFKGIPYVHIPGLGGLRRPRAGSVNTGWVNESFRGYAGCMQTEEFVENLEALVRLAKEQLPPVICAEVAPWRCHRSLLADALTVRG